MISIADPRMDGAEIERAVEQLRSGQLAAGDEVRAFEDEFAAYCGTEHGVATSNGTTALHAALEAVGIGAGDRVITTPFSFAASANAVRLTGAEPVFADVDPETFNLDPHAVEEVIRRTDEEVDAILAVHLFGLAAGMDHLQDVAAEHDLALVEDAAQAHGAEHEGDRVGSFGDAACFSFYPTKNMTTGEGGMITTDRDAVAERAARYINHGQAERYEHVAVGHNYRMTNVAAAIGREQLERLPEFNESRRANANYLTDVLGDAPVVTPTEPAGTRHVYNQYTIQTDARDDLRSHLDEAGIGTGVYYPTCIHRQPAYDDVSHSAPVAERLTEKVLSLPVHPGLSTEDVRTITSAITNHEQ